MSTTIPVITDPLLSIHHVRIYPPIGIARVGNSKDAWFIGPEVPGRFDEPTGGFKDAEGAVKRQARLSFCLHCQSRLIFGIEGRTIPSLRL
jgi:hypothetical protein